jgi:hypothetical protein
LANDFASYKSAGSKKILAQKYNNVLNERLILKNNSNSERVIDSCAVPLLHILLGVVNKIFKTLSAGSPNSAELWRTTLNLSRDSYHGQVFEGNECKKLLDNTSLLQDILETSFDDVPKDLQRLVHLLELYSDINRILHEPEVNRAELQSAIEAFKATWKVSKMTVPTKVHIICYHLLDFVDIRGAANISQFSEQSHEAAHVEFMKTWKNYKVKERNNPRYKNNLYKATLDFNGSHAK